MRGGSGVTLCRRTVAEMELAAAARKKWKSVKLRHTSRSSPETLFTRSESSPWDMLHTQFTELMKLNGASEEWRVLVTDEASYEALLSSYHPLGVLHANALEIYESRMQVLEQRFWVEEAAQLLKLLEKCTMAAASDPVDRSSRMTILASIERATFRGVTKSDSADSTQEHKEAPPVSAALLAGLCVRLSELAGQAGFAAAAAAPAAAPLTPDLENALAIAPRFYHHAFAAVSVENVDKDSVFRRRQHEMSTLPREGSDGLDGRRMGDVATPPVRIAVARPAPPPLPPWLRCFETWRGCVGLSAESIADAGEGSSVAAGAPDPATARALARRDLDSLRTRFTPTEKLECISNAVTGLAAAGKAGGGMNADDVLSALVVTLLESKVRSPHAEAAFITAFAHDEVDFGGASGFCFSCFEAAAEATTSIALSDLLREPSGKQPLSRALSAAADERGTPCAEGVPLTPSPVGSHRSSSSEPGREAGPSAAATNTTTAVWPPKPPKPPALVDAAAAPSVASAAASVAAAAPSAAAALSPFSRWCYSAAPTAPTPRTALSPRSPPGAVRQNTAVERSFKAAEAHRKASGNVDTATARGQATSAAEAILRASQVSATRAPPEHPLSTLRSPPEHPLSISEHL